MIEQVEVSGIMKKFLPSSLLLISVLFACAYLWSERYWYGELGSEFVRVNRFTDSTEYFDTKWHYWIVVRSERSRLKELRVLIDNAVSTSISEPGDRTFTSIGPNPFATAQSHPLADEFRGYACEIFDIDLDEASQLVRALRESRLPRKLVLDMFNQSWVATQPDREGMEVCAEAILNAASIK